MEERHTWEIELLSFCFSSFSVVYFIPNIPRHNLSLFVCVWILNEFDVGNEGNGNASRQRWMGFRWVTGMRGTVKEVDTRSLMAMAEQSTWCCCGASERCPMVDMFNSTLDYFRTLACPIVTVALRVSTHFNHFSVVCCLAEPKHIRDDGRSSPLWKCFSRKDRVLLSAIRSFAFKRSKFDLFDLPS